MRVLQKLFRATLKSWEDLFIEASNFASELDRDQLISISHSQHGAEGIVTVWYWGDAEKCPNCGYDLTGNESGRCPECGGRA